MTSDQRYYRRNRKRKCAYNRRWYRKNKKRIKKYNKIYFQKNKRKLRVTRRVWDTKWRKENPEKAKSRGLKYRYGITLEKLGELCQKQKNKCAICDKAFKHTARKIPCVDHDHKTKKVRGLLCSLCNFAIGLFKDSPEVCVAAARYLKKKI